MIKKFVLDTYPIDVWLFRPCPPAVARKYIEKKYAVDASEMFRYDGFSFAISNDSKGSIFFLWIRGWDIKDGYWPSTLAHELSHNIDNITHYLGIREGEIGRETHAYLMSYLYNKCFTQLEAWRKGRKRGKKTIVVSDNADNTQTPAEPSSAGVSGQRPTGRMYRS